MLFQTAGIFFPPEWALKKNIGSIFFYLHYGNAERRGWFSQRRQAAADAFCTDIFAGLVANFNQSNI
jgi:hypothetical protein